MSARVLAESALRVSDCVTELLRKQPFFGSLTLRLPLRPDFSRETLATDGHEIRYSPRWVAETDSHLIETAMARVVMACALKHHTRRGERDTGHASDAYALAARARVVFTMAIDGRAYARRGTAFDTRLTVAVFVAARSSETVKSSLASAPSAARASVTDTAGGGAVSPKRR